MRPTLLHARPAAPPLLRHHQLGGDGVVVVEGGAVPCLGVAIVPLGRFLPGLDIAMVCVAREHQHGHISLCLT